MKNPGMILIILLLLIPVIAVSTLSPLAIRYSHEYCINGEPVESWSRIHVSSYNVEASVIWSYEIHGETEPDPTEWSYRVEVQAGYWENRSDGLFIFPSGEGDKWYWKDKGTSFDLVRGSPRSDGSVEHKATIDLREAWREDFEPNSFKLTFYRTWGDNEERKSLRVFLIVGAAADEPGPEDLEGTEEDGPGAWDPGELLDQEFEGLGLGIKLPVIAAVGIIIIVIIFMLRKR